jgi:hypothetical protein
MYLLKDFPVGRRPIRAQALQVPVWGVWQP